MQPVLEVFPEGGVAEAEVIGVDNDAVYRIDRAGGADADRGDVLDGQAQLLHRHRRRLGDPVRQPFVVAVHLGGDAGFGEDVVFFVYDARFDKSAAEVNANIVFHNIRSFLRWDGPTWGHIALFFYSIA